MANLTLAVYNVQWMKDLFHPDGTPKKDTDRTRKDKTAAIRSRHLAEVVASLDADILCIVKGPDTLKDRSRTTTAQLEAWCQTHNLCEDYMAIHGHVSRGQQELCALYKKSAVECAHSPELSKSNSPFDQPFLVDTIDDLIQERYEHYRPPFEISVRTPATGVSTQVELMRIIVAHTKSKGIFDRVDFARFERLSERNRRKLYAECSSIRQRCDQWLQKDKELRLAVVGDINDGVGMDYYEQRFARSAIEVLLGTVWKPDFALRHVLPRPRLERYGWSPSSSSYVDRLTGDKFDVLIDHVLLSQKTPFSDALVWNPSLKDAPPKVTQVRESLSKASDHFPISVNIHLD